MYREIPSKRAAWGLKYTKEIEDPKFTTGTEETDKLLLKNLIAFYCVLEGISFTVDSLKFFQWKWNKMTGTAEQFQYILRDESMHVNFGIDLINAIKIENPHLWDEEMQFRSSKNDSEGIFLK